MDTVKRRTFIRHTEKDTLAISKKRRRKLKTQQKSSLSWQFFLKNKLPSQNQITAWLKDCFTERLNRRQYFFGVLVYSLVVIILSRIFANIFFQWLLISLEILFAVSLQIRRLHDLGKSWGYLFFGLFSTYLLIYYQTILNILTIANTKNQFLVFLIELFRFGLALVVLVYLFLLFLKRGKSMQSKQEDVSPNNHFSFYTILRKLRKQRNNTSPILIP